jgi:hypothetical protein
MRNALLLVASVSFVGSFQGSFVRTARAMERSTPAGGSVAPSPPPIAARPSPAPVAMPAPPPAATPASPPVATRPTATERPDELSAGRTPDPRPAVAPLLGIATSDLGFGLGVRGGITIPNHLYFGGSFVYQTGTSRSFAVPNASTSGVGLVSGEVSFSAFYFGGEAGYDIFVGPVTLRPYLGLGIASARSSVSAPIATSSSRTDLVLWPGFAALYDFPDSDFFVGGDVRILTIPGGPSTALFGFGGMRFGG